MMNQRKFPVEELRRFGQACFVKFGVEKQEADWTLNVLLKAELQGRSSHGISRLPAYIEGIKKEKINPVPNIQVQQTTPTTSLVDGDNGLGPVVAKTAIDAAIRSGREFGVGAAAVKSGNHAGALGTYVARAADEGLIGMAFTNAQPAIPPWGSRKAFFGTNPIAMSVGKGDKQIVIDLATSVVARGNIIMASKSGDAIPEGWALDEHGNPTTDAVQALAGAVLPMAGPKGYSLALLVEILSGVLSGAAIGDEVGTIYDDSPKMPNTGMFFLTLNPDMFIGQQAFEERLERMEQAIHTAPLTPDATHVYLPGERRRQVEKKHREAGIELSSQTTQDLFHLAETLGLEPPHNI